jgi:hypothetical protein
VTDPYSDLIAQLQQQNGAQQAWASNVYDNWLPRKLAGLGGGGGYGAPDLGAFQGLLASPNQAEQGAAQGLFNSIQSGGQGQLDAASSVPPNYGRLGNLGQLAFANQANQTYQDQLMQLQLQRAQYEAQKQDQMAQQGMDAQATAQQQAVSLWQAGVPANQIEQIVQGVPGLAPGAADYIPSAFGQPAPPAPGTGGPYAGIDPADAQAIGTQVQNAYNQGLRGIELHSAVARQLAVAAPAAYFGNQAAVDQLISSIYGQIHGPELQASAGPGPVPGPGMGGMGVYPSTGPLNPYPSSGPLSYP